MRLIERYNAIKESGGIPEIRWNKLSGWSVGDGFKQAG
jgi:hypothetical protein